MSEPVRVQRKRTKGFRLQSASPNGLPVKYVGRPTRWGNYLEPARFEWEEALKFYEMHIRNKLKQDSHFLDPLKGKNLACWCSLSEKCHADVLLKILKENQK